MLNHAYACEYEWRLQRQRFEPQCKEPHALEGCACGCGRGVGNPTWVELEDGTDLTAVSSRCAE